ncbi:MAG: large conductance mechanosensitive channel protein MscL [Candidatus Cardinium sp.]|uniref:large conductance mechanosensitive channel protein MscL n=1 Tax=Cardinium endosymbiont of Dermatophagoides farinae TaxID=2597823 RepID=UPI0011831943|nr:large conductance mechanosensitive channel protein MscL [Cardinium endosymbiont of Dermatophagoides farinae]TSJ81048.1 large conductance mechanosensitive channel protein MscL [Cardinium endosymbiont of Dermatophagoides farinae]UWW97078.1 MAG: large conductance mechanosensitive channel protein MscL [Candidatus Cardinium sp.]
MSFIQEFKKFAIRGNVVDLSVGIIMGAAFGKIVTSAVEDLFMPMVNPLLVIDQGWEAIVIGPGIKLGRFLAAVLNFMVINLATFFLIRIIHKLQKFEEKVEEKEQAPTPTEKLLMEIRDALKK